MQQDSVSPTSSRHWQLWQWNSTTIGILLTGLVLLLYGFDPALLRSLDRLASDMRFRARGPRVPGSEVVVVALDEKSIDQLGRWPWPYTLQARLIEQLTAYGASTIGFDVVFSSSDTSAGSAQLQVLKQHVQQHPESATPALTALLDQKLAETDHDGIFATALQRSGRTVLGYFFHWDRRTTSHLSEAEMEQFLAHIRHSKYHAVRKIAGANLRTVRLKPAWAVESNLAVLSQAAWGSGFFNNDADDDGAIRRYPLVVQYRDRVELAGEPDYLFAPLGMRVLEHYLQGQTMFSITPAGVDGVALVGTRNIPIPTNAAGEMLINHRGPGRTFPRYAAVDVVHGHHDMAPPEAFRGKIVLVGATADAMKDLRVTPFDPVLPGVEIHAAAIDSILHNDFLVEPWWGGLYVVLSTLLLGGLLTVLLGRVGGMLGTLSTALLCAGIAVLNYTLFTQAGLWLNLIYPLLSMVIVWAAMTLYNLVVERRRRSYLKRVFEVYVPSKLLAQMEPAQMQPELGGKSGIHTAYFTDIASFSSFSEILSATQLVDLLLEYLTAMTDVLDDEEGTLDKYEGDAIVAFFGAPVHLPDHARRAVRTALKMQQELDRLRHKWTAEGDKWPDLVKEMRMRIGLCAGEMVTGNMGSSKRMNYTMMGDVVNTAARLEASAKQYGVYIQCTTETLQMAGADDFEWRFLDRVRVFGKALPVETVEILAMKGELAAELVQMRAVYHQGLELYRQQAWDEAVARFVESDKLEEQFPRRPTTPSRVYIERCEYFKVHPPEPRWDGSWTLTSK
jgi:adenylate cyclase